MEKATGYKVTYRKLGSGADVIRALASGSVQLGEAGSSPIAAGLSQGVDISLFWILDYINDAEALVARDGSKLTSVTGLRGKKIGVPFVSTSHFHTLVVLQSAVWTAFLDAWHGRIQGGSPLSEHARVGAAARALERARVRQRPTRRVSAQARSNSSITGQPRSVAMARKRASGLVATGFVTRSSNGTSLTESL